MAEDLRALGPGVSYGWGCIAVEAAIGGVTFTTSLIPREGTFLLPLKVAVRREIGLDDGDAVAVEMTIGASGQGPVG